MAEYIERETVLDILASKNAPWNGYQKVSELPAADVQPVKHGKWKHVKWVKDDEEQAGGYWISRCSNCIMPYHSETPYCPHCGAKMDLLSSS